MFLCGSCGHRLRIRTSNDVTATLRQVYYECTNQECREEYSGTHQLGFVVRPSAKHAAQQSLTLFMQAIPAAKREEVLKVLAT